MVKSSQTGLAFSHYRASLQPLDRSQPLTADQALTILCARDALHQALAAEPVLDANRLQRLHVLDAQLKRQGPRLERALEFASYRASLPKKPEGWWWYLDETRPPHPLDRYDWLWKGLTFGSWTATLALLVNLAGRFFSGGPDLAGAVAIILPSLLALLQARSDLTEAGQKGFEQLLKRLRLPEFLYAEARLLSSVLLLVGLLVFWSRLPDISAFYNRRGLAAYDARGLSQAAADYERAIALHPDNGKAHYNLALVYEDWLQLKAAKQEYQVALQTGIVRAHNNLARLYIQEKNYPEAVSLITQGLKLSEEQPIYAEDRYNLFKNLGWARFQQDRDREAQAALETAIAIASDPEVAQYLPNRASAHCLLAQVLDRQQNPQALTHWKQCRDLGSQLIPEEDTWLHLAQQRLQKKATPTNP